MGRHVVEGRFAGRMKLKTLMYRVRTTRLAMWVDRVLAVKKKLHAVLLAAIGVSVMCIFTGLTVAAAPYASASVDNLWVEQHATLTPIYSSPGAQQPMGYMLTGYGKTTICNLVDGKDTAYVCVHVKTGE